MSQNSEQIEAKLCAYLEGELDEQGRAEIEKHLEANPAHRKLLAEVGQTRGMLRALPRESAPPDICEAFQGQLERSVLLADLDDGNDGAALKINRWPQYFAFAAVVMLAAGLGLVVYFGLPSAVPQPAPYVLNGGSNTPAGDGGGTELTPATTPARLPDGLASGLTRGFRGRGDGEIPSDETRSGKEMADAGAGLQGQPAATAPAGRAEDLVALARRVQGSWDPREGSRLFAAVSGPEATRAALADVTPNAHYYVVTTGQPAATSEQIGQELSKLQVAWSALPAPDVMALNQKLGAADPSANTNRAAGRGVAPTDGAAPEYGVTLEPDTGEQAKKDTEADRDASAPVATSAPADVALAAPSAPPAAPAPGPSTRPSQEPAEADQRTAIARAGNDEYSFGNDRKGRPADGADGKAFQQRPATLIVARNLTRQQAETLGVSLNDRRAGRTAKLLAPQGRAHGEVASVDAALETKLGEILEEQHAATQPAGADHVIRPGDALRLEVARGQGEPVVSQFQVAQDGTATIPGLGSLMCEGLTVDQLHKRLTDNLRESEPAGVERVALSKVVQLRKVTDVQEMTVTPGNATGGAGAGAGGARPTEVAGRGAEDRGALRSRTARSMSAPTAATQEHPTAAAAAPAAPQAKTTAAPGAAEAVKPEAETRGGVAATTQQEPQAGGLTRSQATVAPTTASDAPAAVADAEDRFDVVIVVNDAGSDVADAPLAEVGPSTEPAGPIERFEILTVQVGDNDAGTSNVRVAEDGTVELPNVGRVKAEGLTSAELGAQIADKLKQAATGAAAPNVTVKRVGAADAAAPDGEKVEADNPATSAPAQPAEPSPATPVPTGNSDRIE